MLVHVRGASTRAAIALFALLPALVLLIGEVGAKRWHA